MKHIDTDIKTTDIKTLFLLLSLLLLSLYVFNRCNTFSKSEKFTDTYTGTYAGTYTDTTINTNDKNSQCSKLSINNAYNNYILNDVIYKSN